MTEIPYEDFYAAMARWEEVCPSQTVFECFIGTTVKAIAHGQLAYHAPFNEVCFNVPDKIGYNINLLLGPHYQTIIKAYMIQYYDKVNHENKHR